MYLNWIFPLLFLPLKAYSYSLKARRIEWDLAYKIDAIGNIIRTFSKENSTLRIRQDSLQAHLRTKRLVSFDDANLRSGNFFMSNLHFT